VSDPAGAVLVVDDDASVRRALERLLRSAGYRVQTFASAQDLLGRGQFDDVACVVLDVRMPGQGGLDLYEVLVRSGCDLSVVFISGHGDIPMAVRAMKAGAVDFLPKPFEDEALLEAVERAVGRDRQRRDADASEPADPIR